MKHPKRGEIWKTPNDYVFILKVGKHSFTKKHCVKYVMFQSLSHDDRMALQVGAIIASVELRDRDINVLERGLFEEIYKFLPYRSNKND